MTLEFFLTWPGVVFCLKAKTYPLPFKENLTVRAMYSTHVKAGSSGIHESKGRVQPKVEKWSVARPSCTVSVLNLGFCMGSSLTQRNQFMLLDKFYRFLSRIPFLLLKLSLLLFFHVF